MRLQGVSKNSKENTRQYIYRVLRENIMNLNLKPGESIGEIELSKMLNVSRTPLREAIVQLVEEKLLEVFPQRGSFVSKINLNLVEEAIFVRETCEERILKMACQDENIDELVMKLEKNIEYQKIILNFDGDLHEFFTLDNEFHYILFDHYNKKNSWKAIKRLSTHYDRLRLLDALEKTNIEATLNQHIKIVDSIKNVNNENIGNLIEKHLLNYKDVIKKYEAKYPEYFCNK
ncbi:GntR family transcriptional regulator [Cetobacterium somerae]|uniref:GntR family transcriptional regulator n=1 Tax=Cetobacterium sp. NK01 TaxID=2993530 RepID=UPI002115F8F3|nr:GntR family transcriptional regulator [Cetobacterium sp. NK01]MCQ8212139.1 GntR family transcriptional regulator [Cetobacterium sp. NK01]